MSEHSSKEFAYVYTCYDPAIRDGILQYCEERFGHKNYFLDADPGAVKNFVFPRAKTDTDFVLYKIHLALKVHPYTHLLLINHSICGAYADAGISFTDPQTERQYHKSQLQEAEEFLKGEIASGIKIETHYFLKQEQKFGEL